MKKLKNFLGVIFLMLITLNIMNCSTKDSPKEDHPVSVNSIEPGDIMISESQIGQWISGEIGNTPRWYYFTAKVGKNYAIFWDDSYQGSGSYNADIKVSLYDSNKSNMIEIEKDSGYTNPFTYDSSSAIEDVNIYIKVDIYFQGNFGLKIEKVNNLPIPTNVQATYNTHGGKIAVSWNEVIGATGYNIYRSTSSIANGVWEKVNTELVTTTNLDDLSVTVDTTYYYRIKSVFDNEESAFSNYSSGRTRKPKISIYLNLLNGVDVYNAAGFSVQLFNDKGNFIGANPYSINNLSNYQRSFLIDGIYMDSNNDPTYTGNDFLADNGTYILMVYVDNNNNQSFDVGETGSYIVFDVNKIDVDMTLSTSNNSFVSLVDEPITGNATGIVDGSDLFCEWYMPGSVMNENFEWLMGLSITDTNKFSSETVTTDYNTPMIPGVYDLFCADNTPSFIGGETVEINGSGTIVNMVSISQNISTKSKRVFNKVPIKKPLEFFKNQKIK